MLCFLNILWLGVVIILAHSQLLIASNDSSLFPLFLCMFCTCVIVLSKLTWSSLLSKRGPSSLLLNWRESKRLGFGFSRCSSKLYSALWLTAYCWNAWSTLMLCSHRKPDWRMPSWLIWVQFFHTKIINSKKVLVRKTIQRVRWNTCNKRKIHGIAWKVCW